MLQVDVEVESVSATGDWALKTDVAGYSGSGCVHMHSTLHGACDTACLQAMPFVQSPAGVHMTEAAAAI